MRVRTTVRRERTPAIGLSHRSVRARPQRRRLDRVSTTTDNAGAMMARALSIAGSDSGGGAGIQADLKTFSVLGVYGMTAVTALTAQNTCTIVGTHIVPAAFVRQQIEAVVSDIGVDAVKTGMLPTVEAIEVVACAVRDLRLQPLVVDPVMVAQSGASLMHMHGGQALLRELLPLASLVTPNLPEAEVLTGMSIHSVGDMRRAARVLVERGCRATLIKGGHLDGAQAVDVFDDGVEVWELTAPRIATPHTHGTGCQLSAAITAHLARGRSLQEAVRRGKEFITAAIRGGLAIGHGSGPANPLAWKDTEPGA
jgi:hydroxymethylpyrimidine/phosphomethylpyrimidine kinase